MKWINAQIIENPHIIQDIFVFSTSVQTGPGAHPASYAMGTGSFPGVKRQGVAFTTHPHIPPE